MPIRDPWQVLGLRRSATADEVRARYLELVKAHPPEREPARFEELRDAYESLKDERAIAAERVLGPAPIDNLDELRAALQPQRRPVGVRAWMAALEELKRTCNQSEKPRS